MGQLFKKAGYRTYYGGKIHLPMCASGDTNARLRNVDDPDVGPTRYGFDTFLTWDDREILAEEGKKFFETYNHEEPFLLCLSFMNPHDICVTQVLWNNVPIEQYIRELPDPSMELRARFNQVRWRGVYQQIPSSAWNNDDLGKMPFNHARTDRFPISNASLDAKSGAFNSIQRNRAHIWFYYNLMEQVDAEIGMVLDALEKSPFRDNTMIVFTSDHGEMGLSHGLTAKNLPYEESMRVPLIFAGPGVPQGVIDLNTPVSNGWDMLPTMLDLMGLDIPSELHGISLKNKMTKGEDINRKYLYFETVNSFGVLEDGRYKYVRFVTARVDGVSLVDNPFILNPGEFDAMFDLENDQGEEKNLVHNPVHNSKKEQLRSALQAELAIRGINITI